MPPIRGPIAALDENHPPVMPTPANKSKTPRKPSQTARILENVELLLALHQEQEEAGTDRPSSEMVASLEQALEQALKQQIGQRFESLESRIANIADATQQVTQQLAELPAEPHTPSPPSDQQDRILAALEQQSGDLDARFELFAEHIAENMNQAVQDSDAPSESMTQPVIQAIDALGSRLDDRIEGRFLEFDDRISRITSAIEAQQSLIESVPNHESPSTESLTQQLQEKTDSIVQEFSRQIETLFDSLGDRVAQISNSVSQQENFALPEINPEEGSSASHWHRQKAAMLSKYGIDPDYRPLMELPSPEPEPTPTPAMDEENLEALHQTIESMSAEDAETIENLKEELTAKLREAEVEISINRAKLSQFKADLDEKQVELDRRSNALEDKYGSLTIPQKKRGFLERLTRHLTGKQSSGS